MVDGRSLDPCGPGSSDWGRCFAGNGGKPLGRGTHSLADVLFRNPSGRDACADLGPDVGRISFESPRCATTGTWGVRYLLPADRAHFSRWKRNQGCDAMGFGGTIVTPTFRIPKTSFCRCQCLAVRSPARSTGLRAVFSRIFPHIASRIDRFLDPASGDTYQVDRSLEAFIHGGLTGTGPGQGTVKLSLPDAHADFIFAVAGEELGLAATLFIVALFGFIVLRGFARALKDSDLFVVLAVGGLFTQFGLQALIHMGSSLHLLPAKGMTLPFISYGGSSMLALGMGTGMALALTRTRFPGSESR